MDSLVQKHGKNFTAMQYRIWAEMVCAKFHSSMDTSPTTSMFLRAGGGTPTRKNNVAQALNVIANQMTSPISSSPQKRSSVIDSRSKCYKQLMELHNLKTHDILTPAEYDIEKKSVVDTLHSLDKCTGEHVHTHSFCSTMSIIIS